MTQALTQTLPQLLTHEEFMHWYPNDGKRYELHKGVIVWRYLLETTKTLLDF